MLNRTPSVVCVAEFESFWGVRHPSEMLTEGPSSAGELSCGPRSIAPSNEVEFSIAVGIMALEESIGTVTSRLTGVMAYLTNVFSRSSARTRTKFFHGGTRRKTGSFEREVRYHARAMFVVFAEADFSTGTWIWAPWVMVTGHRTSLQAPSAGEEWRGDVGWMVEICFAGCTDAEERIGNAGRGTAQ
jgi:hypothetical protein